MGGLYPEGMVKNASCSLQVVPLVTLPRRYTTFPIFLTDGACPSAALSPLPIPHVIHPLSTNLPFSKWEKNVTRQPRANAGSYFIALPVADRQKGETMKLYFGDSTSITVQSVEELGGRLSIKTIGNTPDQLRVLFTDPVKTKYMRTEERGQTIKEYEGYTEFYRTEEYTGKIYGVVVNKVGESVEERLASAEQTIEQTNTDMQMAIAELTMVIASLQGGGTSV